MKLLGLLFFALSMAAALRGSEVSKVTPQEAAALVAADKAVLIDVREPSEWEETGVAAPAVLLPKSDFDGSGKVWTEFLAKTGDKQLILYCRSGKRAGVIATALAAKGRSVANAGGFKEWEAAGLPTRKVEPAKP
jgi:rhodanese-related sulfurtransferase